jgi:hypothetical protein
MTGADDPAVIGTIVVHADDVVTALEANVRDRTGERSVLRITPPYSGLMRARLHREGHEEYDPSDGPIHVAPAELVEVPPTCPPPDGTEDELRADPDREYTRDRHREYHERRVSEWRAAVRSRLTDRVTLETSDGSIEVEVSVLDNQ